MTVTPTATWEQEPDGSWTPTRVAPTASATSSSTIENWWPPADGGDVYGDIYLDGMFYNTTYWHDVLDGGAAA